MKKIYLVILVLMMLQSCSSTKKMFVSPPKEVAIVGIEPTRIPRSNIEYEPWNPLTETDYILVQFNLVTNTGNYEFKELNYNDTLTISWKQNHWKQNAETITHPDSLVLEPIYTYNDTIKNEEINYVTNNDTSYATINADIILAPGYYELYIWVQPKLPPEEHGIRSSRAVPARFRLIEIPQEWHVATPIEVHYVIKKIIVK